MLSWPARATVRAGRTTRCETTRRCKDGTRVEVVTDYSITGRLARFGRGGMIEEIGNRLLTDFAARNGYRFFRNE